MEQPQYNLLHRGRVEVEYASLYARLRHGHDDWSPLASGLLTESTTPASRPIRGWARRVTTGCNAACSAIRNPGAWEGARRFTALAAQLRIPPASLAIAWCLRNPHVSSVLLGATSTTQLQQNLDALDIGARIDDATWSRVEEAVA